METDDLISAYFEADPRGLATSNISHPALNVRIVVQNLKEFFPSLPRISVPVLEQHSHLVQSIPTRNFIACDGATKIPSVAAS